MAIAFVNSNKTATNNGTTVTVTLTTTAGNDVIVFSTVASNNVVISSVTDTGGSTYAPRVAINNGTTLRTEIWSARNVAASTSVTINYAATTKIAVIVGQYSGVQSLGITGTNTGSSTNPTISLTTQDNNNFVASAVGNHGITAVTAQTGTLRSTINVSTEANGGTSSLIDNTSATPASVTTSDTLGITELWAAAALELRTVAPAASPLLQTSRISLMGAGI